MANSLTGRVWAADTAGVLSTGPVVIKAIGIVPSSAGGTITLKYWDMSSYNTGSYLALTATAATGVITDDDGSHNWLSATAFPAGDVVQVIKTSGAAANKTFHLIGTAGDNDHFHVTPTSGWSDEANKEYVIKCWPSRNAFVGLTQATTAKDEFYYFGEIEFPNLVLATVTNATVYIYMA